MKEWTRRGFLGGCAFACAGSGLWALSCKRNVENAVSNGTTTVKGAAQGTMESYFSKKFGITQDFCEKALSSALAGGAQWADLYFEHSRGVSLLLRDRIVSQAASFVDLGVGCRAVIGDQVGYAFTDSLESADVINAASRASAIARGGESKKVQAFQRVPLKLDQYSQDAPWDIVEVSSLVALLQAIEKKTFAADAQIEKVVVALNYQQKNIQVVSSDGIFAEDSQPRAQLSLSVVINRDGQRQSNGTNLGTRADLSFFTEQKIDEMIADVVARTRILFEAIKPKGGEMPVVLGAGGSGILLHEAIGHGMEADFNRKGQSIFSTMMGKRVANPNVNIIDSGLLPYANGALNMDDEGVPIQETVLVEGGILKSYLHDRLSAKHYGVESTGNGRRESFRHVPYPRMRATYMSAGKQSFEDMIAQVKYGVYCTHFTNGQVDIGAGDYTFYVKNGFLIEDGKLTAPIKDVNIIGNGPDTLSKITALANDYELHQGAWTCGKNGQGVPVSVGMPSVLVSALTVGGE